MSTNKIKLFSGLLLACLFSGVIAQQGVVSAGGDFSGAGGSMSFSTGLTGFSFYESSAGSLQFGLQHAFPVTGDLPPDYELLQDLTILDGETSCFAALITITTAGDGTIFLVESGGRAELIAAGNIFMKYGTRVEQGGTLHARITTDGTFCQGTDKHFLATSEISGTGNPSETTGDTALAALQENFFRVYPNPTTGRLTLELSHLIESNESAFAEVYGMRGERVLREVIMPGQYIYAFSLEGQLPGIYIIRVLSEGQSGTASIIKR